MPNGKTRMYVGAGDNKHPLDDATAPHRRQLQAPTAARSAGTTTSCTRRRASPTRSAAATTRQRGRPVARRRRRQADERWCVHLLDAGANFSNLQTRDVGPAGSQDGMHPARRRTRTSCSSAPTAASCGRAATSADISARSDSGSTPCRPGRLHRPDGARQPQLGSADAPVPEKLLGRPTRPHAVSRVARRTTARGWDHRRASILNQTIWGDGGQSGFNAADSGPAVQRHGPGE